jgi:hypothetical protein
MSSETISKIKPVEYQWGESADDVTLNVGFSAQEIDDLLKCSMTSSTVGAQGSSGSYTISTGANGTWGTGANGTWGTNPYVFTTNNTGVGNISGAGLYVSSDAEFDGDIKWKGRSLGDLLTTIEKRLAILVPDPAKLAHYESLQKAYQHYKTLEALCETPSKKEDK